ncbi:MAG TPA: hypothetical protein VNT52_12525 [Acidimicrobiales bacterium]|nr:hypothetical protein [Acidimicrobiales bacterium]
MRSGPPAERAGLRRFFLATSPVGAASGGVLRPAPRSPGGELPLRARFGSLALVDVQQAARCCGRCPQPLVSGLVAALEG